LYFPYLYGRRGECSALVDVANTLGSPQQVVPIIEPVVASGRDIQRALDALSASSSYAYVIANPHRHDLADAATLANWQQSMTTHLADPSVVRPTLEVRSSTSQTDLAAFFNLHSQRSVAISIRTAHLSPAAIASVFPSSDAVAFLHASANPGGYSAALGNGRTVEVRDSFRKEIRNADYVGQEMFTTAHLNFGQDSRIGFSDYTLLPGAFSAGGGPIGAAALHMSYVDSLDNSIWVEHFVSDATGQREADLNTKMMQAMGKLDSAISVSPSRFIQSPGLLSYQSQFTARTPTNLTNNKRQQISHHLATVASVL
jgi:hypothetical protein